jgi:dTDP-glucose 4,6-dehydratase
MNILITGGCGFIGSNFINFFFNKISNKYDIEFNLINIDCLNYCSDIENVEQNIRNKSNYYFYQENICNKDFILRLLNKHEITHIIHFAAQSHVQNSFDNSLDYTNDNILGTHVLLESSRVYNKLKKFIHISTDEVYGESLLNESELKKNEQSILCPTNPYAATKAAAELIAKSYYYSFKLPIIITRGNNVYGPNQYPEKVIPRFIELLLKNEKITIQGDGTNVRGFMHVEDTCFAIEKILFCGTIGEIYNIGCDENSEISIIELAKILIKKIKKENDYSKYISYIQDRPFNDKRYYISNNKLTNLGWKQNVLFETGIDELINHVKNNNKSFKNNPSLTL